MNKTDFQPLVRGHARGGASGSVGCRPKIELDPYETDERKERAIAIGTISISLSYVELLVQCLYTVYLVLYTNQNGVPGDGKRES